MLRDFLKIIPPVGLGLEPEFSNLKAQNALAHKLNQSKFWVVFLLLLARLFVCFYSQDKSIEYSPNLLHRTTLSPVVREIQYPQSNCQIARIKTNKILSAKEYSSR